MNHPNAKRSRRGYRLNKKRFAGTLIAVCFMAIVIAVAAKTYEDAAAEALRRQGDEIGVIAIGSGVPEKTAGSGPTAAQQTPAASQSHSPGELVIVVDAGHGGFDPGTSGVSGTQESELNLEVAQCLKDEMEARGAKVVMTRESDDGLGDTHDESLRERRRIIEENRPDLVVSVHMNSFRDDDVSGPLVLFTPGSQQSKDFADTVQHSLNEALEAGGTARSQSLYVLESGSQPSVLVECGYMSNAKEEKNLKKPEYQKKIAEAICDGIDEYLGKGSKNN